MTQKFARASLLGFVGLGAVVGSIFYFKSFPAKQQIAASASRAVAAVPGYCIAIRGNGELQPAHWGAMARTVEQLGLPSAMAGGSSATITMMMMEAMASHPLVANQNSEVQKIRASLLWKSMLGAFGELKQTKQWQNLEELYGRHVASKKSHSLKKIQSKIVGGQLVMAQALLDLDVKLGILDMESIAPLKKALLEGDRKRVDFYAQQLHETVTVFGKFNAEKDENLFFRMGLVSFENAAVSFGKIASFYAALNEDSTQLKNWETFFTNCAPNSVGKSWIDIVTGNPTCAANFHTIFIQSKSSQGRFETRQIGTVIPVFPITSVLIDSAAQEYRDALKQYHIQMDPHFGKNFKPKNPEDVRFGYWGDPQSLKILEAGLDSRDEKSRRFLSLGSTDWKQVLALSPAEPGLAPLKEFATASGQKYVSAGGWPDLVPVAALKAAGCENVVLLTRQGGESLFAQGVAKRLLSLDRDWSSLRSGDESVRIINNDGDARDMTSLWSNLYNLANPKSSLNSSLSKANVILCTDWNSYDVKKDFIPLIENAYRSSFWINPSLNSEFAKNLGPVLKEPLPGCGVK